MKRMRTSMVGRFIATALFLGLSGLPIGAGAAGTAAAGAPPDVVAAGQALAQLGTAHTIEQGQGARVVFVFVDPNCPYCRALFRDLQPWVGRDGLAVRWVPVAVLAPSSLGKAAAIVQAADPFAALRATELHGLDSAVAAPPALAVGEIRPATRAALAANAAALNAAGAYAAVPLMVFRNTDGVPQLEMALPRSHDALRTLLGSIGPLKPAMH